MDLKEIGVNTRNWVYLAQDIDYWRVLVNAALNLRFHKQWSWLLQVLVFYHVFMLSLKM